MFIPGAPASPGVSQAARAMMLWSDIAPPKTLYAHPQQRPTATTGRWPLGVAP